MKTWSLADESLWEVLEPEDVEGDQVLYPQS